MPTTKWNDLKTKKLGAERVARINAEAKAEHIALTLRQLREAAGMTQNEMADLVEITQSALSRMERRDDNNLDTVRKYVEALGGKLELVAVIGNKRVNLMVA
jgi:DNA-binding XRE family transcriptional regulator